MPYEIRSRTAARSLDLEAEFGDNLCLAALDCLAAAILVGLFGVIMAIVAGIKASNGVDNYRYPLTIRLL